MAASIEASVELAERTIVFYREITKGDHEPAANLRDLLTDLMHWADSLDINLDAVVDHAVGVYEEEVDGDCARPCLDVSAAGTGRPKG